jgi:hypothetical protein
MNNENDSFTRIRTTIDVDLLNKSTLIGVGCGGARSYYLDMARMGISNFILIDGDKVETVNISSQGVYADEIGKYKVDVIATEIKRINPLAKVTAINKFLSEDTFSDKDFEKLLNTAPDRTQILLCGHTDDFKAQARLSLLALKYSLPYIGGGNYLEGIGSEFYYWYPGISLACPRCLLHSRYDMYFNGDFDQAHRSNTAPYFVTVRLNSLREKISLGILLYKQHPDSQFCSFLIKEADKNFCFIRNNEDMFIKINFKSNFGLINNDEYHFNDDTIWFNYREICGSYICPDCDNTGQLSKNIKDTLKTDVFTRTKVKKTYDF